MNQIKKFVALSRQDQVNEQKKETSHKPDFRGASAHENRVALCDESARRLIANYSTSDPHVHATCGFFLPGLDPTRRIRMQCSRRRIRQTCQHSLSRHQPKSADVLSAMTLKLQSAFNTVFSRPKNRRARIISPNSASGIRSDSGRKTKCIHAVVGDRNRRTVQ